MACTEDRFCLKKTFNRPHRPKRGDFYHGIYHVLRSWLLCICCEKFCVEARILLGEVDITVLHARQIIDTHKKQLLIIHYKVQYARAMLRQVLAAEQSWRALQKKIQYAEKNAV